MCGRMPGPSNGSPVGRRYRRNLPIDRVPDGARSGARPRHSSRPRESGARGVPVASASDPNRYAHAPRQPSPRRPDRPRRLSWRVCPDRHTSSRRGGPHRIIPRPRFRFLFGPATFLMMVVLGLDDEVATAALLPANSEAMTGQTAIVTTVARDLLPVLSPVRLGALVRRQTRWSETPGVPTTPALP